MDIVVIRWKDSQSVEGWVSLEEAEKEAPTECVTVGRYIKQTEDYIVITPTQGVLDGEEIQFLGVLTIPRGAITYIGEFPIGITP